MAQKWTLARLLSIEGLSTYTLGLLCLTQEHTQGTCIWGQRCPQLRGTAAETLQETARGDTRTQRRQHQRGLLCEDLRTRKKWAGGTN